MAKAFILKWRGEEVYDEVIENVVSPALRDFGLHVEGKSKQKLKPSPQVDDVFVMWRGTGKRTGTLQRSIHTATPGYSWAADDVKAAKGTPERGLTSADPGMKGGKLVLEFGSGLQYAIYVHQLHYNPTVKHFLLNAAKESRPDFHRFIAKYAR